MTSVFQIVHLVLLSLVFISELTSGLGKDSDIAHLKNKQTKINKKMEKVVTACPRGTVSCTAMWGWDTVKVGKGK